MSKIVIAATVIDTIEVFLIEQIKHLKKQGLDVVVIAGKGQWTSFSLFKKKIDLKAYQVFFFRRVSVWNDLRSILQVVRIVAFEKPDIVHYMTPKASLVCSIAAFIAGVKCRVYSEWGLPYFGKRGFYRLVMQNLDKLTCALSTNVLPNSHSNMDYLIEKKICSRSKLHVIGSGSSHGVDAVKRFSKDLLDMEKQNKIIGELGTKPSDIIVGFVGRMTVDKGFNELIEACDILFESLKNVHLLIIGLVDKRDSVSTGALKEIVSRENVHIIRNTFNVEQYYGVMDVFVLPSHREGFPNVVLEASAMSLPVITTNAIGCIDSVVDNETGLIVPKKNAKALSEALIKLCKDEKLRTELGKKGRERVLKEFSPERINEALTYFYKHKKYMN